MAAATAGPATRMPESLEERLAESRQTYKLNVGYAGLPQLPAGFVELVKKHNPHIADLDLSSNNLTDLPDDFGELRGLKVLRIKYNQLARLPAPLARLPQLATLELSGNQIARLDSSISKITSLRELDLSGNLLTELPSALALLPKLEVLRLENNRLDALPDNIGELPALVKLDVSTNCLRCLPASMGRLKRVQRIDAGNNLLTRVPPAMGHLKSIKELSLKYNSLDERYKAKAEEGLSRLLAFLREEEERERLEEIERLRPVGTAVGRFTEYRCKAEASQLLMTEFGDFTVDNRCWVRTGFSLTQVHNLVYIFGGQLVKDGSVSNELFWMTSERMEWHCQPTRGDRPCGRHGHCAVYDPDHHQLVVFGGRNADRKRLSDVAVLDLESFTWRRPAVSGTAPSAREGAAAVYHAGHMVLFAGHATGGRTNDLLLLELSGWTWSQPTTTGTAPSPRSGAAMCVGHGHFLIIHGGRNNFVLDTTHMLDLLTRTWIDASALGVVPPPRHSHLLHVHNEALYMFGGVNELGAATVSLFRAALPRAQLDRAGVLASAAASFGPGGPSLDSLLGPDGGAGSGAGGGGGMQLEWTELDAELPFNKSRAAVLQGGQLRCYQLGSATLGRTMNEDDAEKGLVHWDVYKIASLEAFKPKPLAPAADGDAGGVAAARAGSGKATRVQHATHSAGKLPPSFSSNSPKEARLLAYVGDFQRVFQELYPHRRPMPLAPLNECGVPKFVCTSLRPSLPPCPELYVLASCAKFVAEFLTFEPLANPLHPPAHVASPSSVLAWQAADAFDAAGLLASLLLGAGFNAFVVFGYAPLAVTLNDQSGVECPLLAEQAGAPGGGAQQPAAAVAGAKPAQRSTSTSTSASAAGAASSGGAAGGAGAPAPGQCGPGGESPGSSGSGSSSKPGGAAAAAADEPGKRRKYQVPPKPELLSKFLQQHAASTGAEDSEGAGLGGGGSGVQDGQLGASPGASTAQTPEPGTAGVRGSSSADERSSNSDAGGAATPAQGADAAATDADEDPDTEQDREEQRQAKLLARRVHAWVLVLPGRREVSAPVFVEPATGRQVSPSAPECPYTGVEMIWSSSNAWICMQAPEPHSDSRAAPASISWDLSNTALWEPVLDERQTRPPRSEPPDAGRGGSALPGMASRAGMASSMAVNSSIMASSMHVGARPHTPGAAGLPRTPTLAAMAGSVAGAPGGIAAGLSRVASKSVLQGLPGGAASAAGTGSSMGAAAAGPPGTPDGPRMGTLGGAAEPGFAGSVVGGHTARGPASEYARSDYARSELGDGSAAGGAGPGDDARGEAELLPDLPPSWVPKLCVTREMCDMRCPRGSRVTLFKRCTHEIFAGFGECARWDGLVERLTRFADDERHTVLEVRELFARRKDKLRERRTFPQQDTVQESFACGSLFAVKDLLVVRGTRRDISFYSAARLDGLVRREELFGVKLTEHFAGRDDHLVYRSATFGPAPAPSAAAAAGGTPAAPQPSLLPEPGGSGGGSAAPSQQQQQERAVPVAKATQRFARNPAKPADEDAARVVYYLAAGKTLVQYHHGDGRLVAGHLVFYRDGSAQAVQVDPLAPHPSTRALLELCRALQAGEKAVLQAVRDSEWEGREIGRTRNAQEQGIALDTPYYDVCRVQAEDLDDEPPDSEATAFDYLLPFLPPGMALAGGAGSLTREQALAVRERCLRALKDRLIERANIIQARLDEEQAALARRQTSYARDRDSLSPAQEEEYVRAADEAAFRVGILQRRLARHEETALASYYALDKRLRGDARLSMLLKPV